MLSTHLSGTWSDGESNAANTFIRDKKIYYASIDYTFASENVPNEHREEFRRTLALLMDRVTFIEIRLPHYYTLLTEVYIERAIQIIETIKWQERLLYSPRGHSGYIFTLTGLRDALAALINLQIIAVSVEYWTHTPEGVRLTYEFPKGEESILLAKDRWLKRNLTPVTPHNNLEVVLDHLSEYALKEYSLSPPSSPSLTSASARSSLSPSPPPISPQSWLHTLYEECVTLSYPGSGSLPSKPISTSYETYHEDRSDTMSITPLTKCPKSTRSYLGSWLQPFLSRSPSVAESNYEDSYSDLSSESTDSEDEWEVDAMLNIDHMTVYDSGDKLLPLTTSYECTLQSLHWTHTHLLPRWLQNFCGLFCDFS